MCSEPLRPVTGLILQTVLLCPAATASPISNQENIYELLDSDYLSNLLLHIPSIINLSPGDFDKITPSLICTIRNSEMNNIIYVAVILILSGCATAYQPKGLSGGFSEIQLSVDTFQVSFNGNGYTDPSRATEFTLLRSSEIALENGYRYFVIIDSKIIDEHTARDKVLVNAGVIKFAARKPSASNTIICFQDKPDNALNFYDAELVSRSIRKKYGI